MSTYQKKKGTANHLPGTFYLFGLEADWRAIQFSFFYSLKVLQQILHSTLWF